MVHSAAMTLGPALPLVVMRATVVVVSSRAASMPLVATPHASTATGAETGARASRPWKVNSTRAPEAP